MRFLSPLAAVLAGVLTATPLAAQQVWDDRSALVTAGGVSSFVDGVYANGGFFLITSSTPYWRSAAGTAGWTSDFFRDQGSFYSSSGVAYGAGTFVVVGQNGRIYQHPTGAAGGAAWNARGFNRIDLPAGTNPVRNVGLSAVRFLNNRFLAAAAPFVDSVTFANSYSELLSSPDGITWTSHKFPVSQTGNAIANIASLIFRPGGTPGTGSYVLGTTSSDVIVVNEALTTATRVNVAASNAASLKLAATSSLVVGVSSTGRIFTSPNGTAPAWTTRTNPVAGSSQFFGIFHDGTTFVAVGVKGSSPAQSLVLVSADGLSWSEATSVPTSVRLLRTVLRADGLWLTGGENKVLFTSGSSSVALPAFTQQPVGGAAVTGGNFSFSVAASGPPAPTFTWFKDGAQVSDGGRISGATTTTLTITGATFADAGAYFARATNTVGPTNSNTVSLTMSAAGNGALLYPFGVGNTGAGELLPGASPAKVTVTFGAPNVGIFTAGGAVVPLPNTTINGQAYTFYGGLSPDGTKLALSTSAGAVVPAIYDLASSTATLLPAFPLPLGPVNGVTALLLFGLASNGNVTGLVRDQASQNRGFHYDATTQTYTLLGTVPNATNDVASNPAAISDDGSTISGYERTGIFNGAFVWTTTGGFALLPGTTNGGTPNGDNRDISPSGRFTVGFGAVPSGLGGGNTAQRWDRGPGLGAPVGVALSRPPGANFADCRSVNDDGTVAGHVRTVLGVEHATVWLPSGARIQLGDYLTTTYGLDLTGFRLTRVTSISPDRRTLAGNAQNAAGLQEGWILTLPAPLDLTHPQPNLSVLIFGSELNPQDELDFGSGRTGTLVYIYPFAARSDGSADLTGLSATISGAHPGDFVLTTNELPPTLPSYRSANLRVSFTPTARGLRTATLTIASNDPDTPNYVLFLKGTGLSAAEVAFNSFVAAAPFNQRGLTDDPDGDGISNLLEFALGRSAMVADAVAAPQAQLVGGTLTLTYPIAQPGNVSYVVEASTDLQTWSSAGVDQGTPSGGFATAAIPGGSIQFLRLRVALLE